MASTQHQPVPAAGGASSSVTRKPRVLCYSPYNWIPVHALWEMTVAKGLLSHGADVDFVVCDGLFSDCDIFWEATNPRPPHACTICQAAVTNRALEMELNLLWLGRFLQTDEWRTARQWSDTLGSQGLFSAGYGEWPIAEWMISSVRSHLRAGYPDESDAHVQAVMRSYLFSGLIACFAIDRLIRETKPDVLLVINGRQSSTRVALELGRRHGLRVVTSESAPRSDMITLLENETAISVAPYEAYWSEWHDVPLDRAELGTILQYMLERQYGRDAGKPVYTSAPQPLEQVASALGLRPGRAMWALFTSSDDEVIGTRDTNATFASQNQWVKATIAYAGEHPEIDLVIRVHPNTGSRRSYGHNRAQAAGFQEMKTALPPNVMVVDPESEISSYSLMDLSTVGLVWASTVGLEMACKGKVVLTAAGSFVSNTSFSYTARQEDDYEALLDQLLRVRPLAVDPEIARSALRHAYGVFYRLRIPFPLVRSPFPGQGERTYTSFDALQPGHDQGLDRACRIVLDGEAVCLPPTAEHLQRGLEAENHFLSGAYGLKAAVLSYADELVAKPAILHDWASAARSRRDVTLLIETEPARLDDLVAVVTAAGCLGGDSPELVAGEFTAHEHDRLAGATQFVRPFAVLSPVGGRDGFSHLPSYAEPSVVLSHLDSLGQLDSPLS